MITLVDKKKLQNRDSQMTMLQRMGKQKRMLMRMERTRTLMR
jgi:hypothetical protein